MVDNGEDYATIRCRAAGDRVVAWDYRIWRPAEPPARRYGCARTKLGWISISLVSEFAMKHSRCATSTRCSSRVSLGIAPRIVILGRSTIRATRAGRGSSGISPSA